MSCVRTLLISVALLGVSACGAGTISQGDLPEPGQAVAFARIEVSGIRMSRLAIHRAVAGGAERGPQVATIKARLGSRTYAVYLDPGQYAIHGVLEPGDIKDGVPSGTGGILLFDVTAKTASYFGSFRMLTESGRLSVADLGEPAYETARREFAEQHPVLKAGFAVVNAIARTDRMTPEKPADQPEPDAAPETSFEDEWKAAPAEND
jgi:hypothetical protein